MTWTPTSSTNSGGSELSSDQQRSGATTRDAQSVQKMPSTSTTEQLESSPFRSSRTAQSSGGATTANGTAASADTLTAAHAKRLRGRGLDPELCVRLGFHSAGTALGFHYLQNGQIHNTKIRRGKGDMPWASGGRPLILWNSDSLAAEPAPDEFVIIAEGELDGATYVQAGFTRVVSLPNGAQTTDHGFSFLFGPDGALLPDLEKFSRFVIATDGDAKGIECRDALAVRLGDDRCSWVEYPKGLKGKPDGNQVLQDLGMQAVVDMVLNAKPMWTDEVCRIDDVVDPGVEQRFRIGIRGLEAYHVTLPAFWPIMGPYSSGKSVLARQVLVSMWQSHGWPFLLTSFEERIKPRYERDLRRHFIGRPMLPDAPWTAEEIAAADEEIRRSAVFLRRRRGDLLDLDRLINRIEYAVRVYGVRVVCIDPANEVDHRPDHNESRTEYMGRFIRSLKALGEDYGLLVIVVGHVSKDAAEKRLAKRQLLTLNDGEDTRHWGGKADIGWCMWRDVNGPTMLHVDKVKDHETMGRPDLFELELDRAMNAFRVARSGYDLLAAKEFA